MDATLIASAAALAIAATAAVTDHRTGEIPNWLTLPPLAIAPVAFGVLGGAWAAAASLGAALVCGLVPYLLFRRGAAGGGDVKLFAAVGALTGVNVGLEAELLTLLATAIVTLGQLAWRGRLLATLSNSLFLALNPVLPRRHRRAVAPELMTMVRLGGFALLGTAAALYGRYPW